MESNLFDVALLLGIKAVTGSVKLSIQEPFFDSLCNNQSKFSKKLPLLLYQAIRGMDIDILSNNLFISNYFIRLLNPRNDRCGRCLICDKYYSRIKKHLKLVHMIESESVYVYANIFGEGSYFYMPLENRKAEEFTDYSSKTKKPVIKTVDDPMIEGTNLPLSKGNFKNKILSRVELTKSNCVICGDCGKIITQSNKYDHAKNHRRNETVKCPICDKRMRKKYLPQHTKTHISP